MSVGHGQTFVLHADHLPQAALTTNEVVRLAVKDGVAFNHLLEDVFEFVVRGEGRCSGCFLEQGFDQLTSDVFLLLGELRLQSKPQDGPAAVISCGRLVDVNENRFSRDVDEVQRTLLFGVSIERTVVDWA